MLVFTDQDPRPGAGLEPAGNGDRTFRLRFYHANYPEGVRDNDYLLRTIERGRTYLLARAVDYEPARFLQVCEVTPEWLVTHFGVQEGRADDPQAYLEANA